MRIKKILNNSLVLAEDEHQNEMILMGKGIGYHCSVHVELKEEDIKQIFVLKDQKTLMSILQLAKEVDEVYFEIAKNSIDFATETYQMELMNHIYLSLTDHIAFAVRRQQEGIETNSFYLADIRIFYPEEYAVGAYTRKQVETYLDIILPEEEITNIALHFVNTTQKKQSETENNEVAQIVKDILTIIQYHFSIHFQKETISFNRFLTHLNAFGKRLVRGEIESGSIPILFEQVRQNCEEEYCCVQKINAYLLERGFASLGKSEELYLTVHIHQVLEQGSERFLDE